MQTVDVAMDRIKEQMLENTLIEYAAAGDVDKVKELVAMGINVNTQNAVNGWTPLHWACKRGYTRVVQVLLKAGADKHIVANNGEVPVTVCMNTEILELLRDARNPGTPKAQEGSEACGSITTINNYLKSAPLSPSSRPGHARPAVHHNDNSVEAIPVQQDGIVLKVRLANSNDPDFIEVEISRRCLSYATLLQVCCDEMQLCDARSIERLRKLPNTRLKCDADVRRLQDYQEIEVVTYASNNFDAPATTILTPANAYQSISNKDQTILY